MLSLLTRQSGWKTASACKDVMVVYSMYSHFFEQMFRVPFGYLWGTSPCKEGLRQLECVAEICRHHLLFAMITNTHLPTPDKNACQHVKHQAFVLGVEKNFVLNVKWKEWGQCGCHVIHTLSWTKDWAELGVRCCVSGVLHPLAMPFSVGICILRNFYGPTFRHIEA